MSAPTPAPDCIEDWPQHLGPCPFHKVPGVLAPHDPQTAPQSCLCWLFPQPPWPRLDTERSRSSPDYQLISTQSFQALLLMSGTSFFLQVGPWGRGGLPGISGLIQLHRRQWGAGSLRPGHSERGGQWKWVLGEPLWSSRDCSMLTSGEEGTLVSVPRR